MTLRIPAHQSTNRIDRVNVMSVRTSRGAPAPTPAPAAIRRRCFRETGATVTRIPA
jgi:hypothetical protein